MMLSDVVAGQLVYHVCRAAALAAAGRHSESTPESILAWALLQSVAEQFCNEAMERTDLPTPAERAGGSIATAEWRRARDLALALAGHFASEQQSDLASLYQAVADYVEDRPGPDR
jgi:hypothetical protein